MFEKAPLFTDIAEGPEGGVASWVETEDGIRVRIGCWDDPSAKGTVLLFPGRTEYIEKYGRTAKDFAALGLSTLAIDWRGQGLADRILRDRLIGHVDHFTDYQRDVRAMLRYAEARRLPKPWFILGHSMGGCIALRAVMEGAPVSGVMFTAPMWGIQLTPLLRPVAWTVSWAAKMVSLGHLIAPSTSRKPYPEVAPFLGNLLTTDSETYDYMKNQTRVEPDLALGGPSLHWLNQALRETNALASMPSPKLPCLTFLGTLESIVDSDAVHRRMGNWDDGQLVLEDGGQHEVLMETPEIRADVMRLIGEFTSELIPA